MASIRVILCTSLTASALALACSSSTTGNGTSGGASGASGTFTKGIDKCGGISSSNCTPAEVKQYDDCFATACDSKFSECYGADWKAGVYAGPCGTYTACFNACACGDTDCFTKCPDPSAECSACRIKSSSCSDGCKLPACGTASTSGGTACAKLAACCAKIESPSFKQNCDQSKETAGTDNDLCSTFVGIYKTGCP